MASPCCVCDRPAVEGMRLVAHIAGAWNITDEVERWFCLACAARAIRYLELRGFSLIAEEKRANG